MKMNWKNVDSHVENRIHKYRQSLKGDKYSILLNIVVGVWVGNARENGVTTRKYVMIPQIYYEEEQVIVKTSSSPFVYGNLKSKITEDILQADIIKCLMCKNPTWTVVVFETAD